MSQANWRQDHTTTMNERPRRQPATRRRASQETVGGGQSLTAAHQHPSTNSSNHHQNNNSNHHSVEHHNNYHVNYRHPSTTTNSSSNPSTSASSSSQSTGDNNAFSICYSYLIAIFSSFLVVLGLYLAITKFNVRYLYISLVGISFEALGACIYCISNTRANKLTRSKQRVSNANNNAYMLNDEPGNNTNGGNSSSNSNNINSILHINNPHLRSQQQHAPDLNNVLDNRISTSRADNTTTNRVFVETDSSLVVGGPSLTSSDAQPPKLPPPRVSTGHPVVEPSTSLIPDQNDNPTAHEKEDNPVVIINVLNESSQPDAPSTIISSLDTIASSPKQLPNIDACQTKIKEPSNNAALPSLSRSPAAITGQLQLHTNLVEIVTTTPDNAVAVSTKNTQDTNLNLNQTSGDNLSITPTNIKINVMEEQVGTSAASQQQLISIDNSTSVLSPSNSIDLIQLSLGNERTDEGSRVTTDQSGSNELGLNVGTSSTALSHCGLVPSAPSEHQMLMKRSPAQGPRNVHLRRTLVVGLGGEEELMEIDEEDLDNMSILPPSYDSIAQNRF